MTNNPYVSQQWTPTPWTPPPAAPTRRTSVVVPVLVTAVIFAILCSGAGYAGGYAAGYFGGRPHPAASAAAAPSAPGIVVGPSTSLVPRTPSPIPIGDGAVLHSRLAPHTAVSTFPIKGAPDGLETPAQVAAFFSTSASVATEFRTWGCVVAAENDWLSPDGVAVDTRLIQFRTAEGAGDFWTFANDGQGPTDAFPISGVGYAWAYERTERDANGWIPVYLLYQDGPIAIEIFIYTYGTVDWSSDIALLQKQIDALAA